MNRYGRCLCHAIRFLKARYRFMVVILCLLVAAVLLHQWASAARVGYLQQSEISRRLSHYQQHLMRQKQRDAALWSSPQHMWSLVEKSLVDAQLSDALASLTHPQQRVIELRLHQVSFDKTVQWLEQLTTHWPLTLLLFNAQQVQAGQANMVLQLAIMKTVES